MIEDYSPNDAPGQMYAAYPSTQHDMIEMAAAGNTRSYKHARVDRRSV